MFPYIILLIFAYCFSRLIVKTRVGKPQLANQQKWVFIFVLSAFIGLRYAVGADYFAYIHDYYKWVNLSWGQVFASKEPLIRLLAKLCHTCHTPEYVPVLFFFAMAFIFVSLSICTIYKYSTDFTLSVLLFILIGCYLDSCNASRQCMATGIMLANYDNICKRRLLRYLLLTGIATLFHSSAITLLPIYFIFAPDLSLDRQLLWLLGTGTLLFVSYATMMHSTATIMGKELETNVEYFRTTVNIFRVLVFIAPCLFVLLLRKGQNAPLPQCAIFILFNAIMALVTCQSAYLMRICIYTNIFLCLALPEIFQKLTLPRQTIGNIILIALVLYFIYWTYGIYNSAGLYPYKNVMFI